MKGMNGMKQIGRLAMREEGEVWKAYYAEAETMKDAVFLGSIRMGAIRGNEARKEAFMLLMRGLVADLLEGVTGTRPSWTEPQPAPDTDRWGV